MQEKIRREGMRWHIINTLNKARPIRHIEGELAKIVEFLR